MAQDSHRNSIDVSMDRISSLPEPIICHILSFLPTTDAVKTTLLSPKFLNLWKNITTLRFSYCGDMNDKKTMRFVNFVNRVFFVFETKCIDTFSIKLSGFDTKDVIRDSLSNWLAAAVAKNVKNLEVLNLSDIFKPWFQLPSFIFTCKSLETLHICDIGVMLNVSGSVCLPNLTILSFDGLSIQGDKCIDKIVSGCSSLHTLYLKTIESYDMASFSICSPTLEELLISSSLTGSSSSDSKEDEEIGVSFCRIKIDAPALKFLYLNHTVVKYLSIKTSSPLLEAQISLGAAKRDQGTFHNLIQSLSNAKVLILDISDVWLEASAHSCLLPMFPNLTDLTLWKFSGQFYLLKEFLRQSPTLEILYLVFTNSSGSNSFGEPNLIPGYKSPFLKMVTVDNFDGTTNQLKVLEYILLNASLLETMKIKTPPTSERKVELLHEISNFSRKSTHCRITVD